MGQKVLGRKIVGWIEMEPNMTNALILDNQRRALLIHNCKNGSDRWEFPGGKRKEGEDLEMTTVRELGEELDVRIRVGDVFGDYETQTPEGQFLCRTYFAEIVSGSPQIVEGDKHDMFRYCSYEDLERFRDEGTLVPNLVEALPDLVEIVN